MKQLQVNLWREWREHRRTLGVLAFCLILVGAILAALLPQGVFSDPLIMLYAMGTGTLLVAMCVGADLVAAERQRGTLDFLNRVPGGLHSAFGAKLLFFLWSLVVGALMGSTVAAVMTIHKAGSLPVGWHVGLAPPFILACSASLWVLAASSWVKSGALAIPAALLFLATALFPAYLAANPARFNVPYAHLYRFTELAWPGAILSFWIAFVFGGRIRCRRGKSIVLSLLAGCLFFSPSWAWAVSVLRQPGLGGHRVSFVMLGEGERYAYVNLNYSYAGTPWEPRKYGKSAVLVDLAGNQANFAGEPLHSTWNLPSLIFRSMDWMQRRGLPVVEMLDNIDARIGESQSVLLDGRTAERSENAANASWLAAFNEGYWPSHYSRIEDIPRFHPAGTGYLVSGTRKAELDQRRFWDPARGRVVNIQQLGLPAGKVAHAKVLVAPERWLVKPGSEAWRLVDPDTGDYESIDGIGKDEEIQCMLDDGSVLLLRDDRAFRYWAETGELREFSFTGQALPGFRILSTSFEDAALSSTQRTAFAFSCEAFQNGTSQQHGLALLDPASNSIKLIEFGTPGEALGRILVQSHSIALVSNDRQLRKLNYDSAEFSTVLDLTDVNLGIH